MIATPQLFSENALELQAVFVEKGNTEDAYQHKKFSSHKRNRMVIGTLQKIVSCREV